MRDTTPIKANSRAEFDQAKSDGEVYGRVIATTQDKGKVGKYVYIELGQQVGGDDGYDRDGRFRQTDLQTKGKLFINCEVTPADTMEELLDEDLDLETFLDQRIYLYY
jgi:hypothetical protein